MNIDKKKKKRSASKAELIKMTDRKRIISSDTINTHKQL